MAGHPEIAIALVPTWVFRCDKGFGLALAGVYLIGNDLFIALVEHVGAALEE
ncbi:hypothetical protein D3C77_361260 [compost metagenome]